MMEGVWRVVWPEGGGGAERTMVLVIIRGQPQEIQRTSLPREGGQQVVVQDD